MSKATAERSDGVIGSSDKERAGLPAFSILIAAYNAEATLPATLDSILAQTRVDWEAIVTDDGSTDSTLAIAREYANRDPRIKVVTQANAGAASARNAAARWAAAPILSVMDADDMYRPEYFERMGIFISEHPGFDIYSSDGYVLRLDGSMVPDSLQPDSTIRSYTAEDLLARNRIRVQASFRSSLMERLVGFDENAPWHEDWDFWLRALLTGARHIHNPERLFIYRRRADSTTADLRACYAADVRLYRSLLSPGRLSKDRRLIVKRGLGETRRRLAPLEARYQRAQLVEQLEHGDFRGVRAMYLRSSRAWKNRRVYRVGVVVMMVSPRLFARLFAKRRSSPHASGV